MAWSSVCQFGGQKKRSCRLDLELSWKVLTPAGVSFEHGLPVSLMCGWERASTLSLRLKRGHLLLSDDSLLLGLSWNLCLSQVLRLWAAILIIYSHLAGMQRKHHMWAWSLTGQNNVKVLTVQVVTWTSTAVKALVALWWRCPGSHGGLSGSEAAVLSAFCTKVHLVQIVKSTSIYCPKCSFWHKKLCPHHPSRASERACRV